MPFNETVTPEMLLEDTLPLLQLYVCAAPPFTFGLECVQLPFFGIVTVVPLTAQAGVAGAVVDAGVGLGVAVGVTFELPSLPPPQAASVAAAARTATRSVFFIDFFMVFPFFLSENKVHCCMARPTAACTTAFTITA